VLTLHVYFSYLSSARESAVVTTRYFFVRINSWDVAASFALQVINNSRQAAKSLDMGRDSLDVVNICIFL